jgi:aspartate-semialdehyde dehydrogenase
LAEQRTVAIVGSETLLGREVRDVAAEEAPELRLRLLAAEEDRAGEMTSVGDEPAVVMSLAPDSFEGAGAVVLAGSEESGRKALELIERESGAAVIDLTQASEDHAGARLRAPAVESEPEESEAGVHVIAHPAAIALALLLRRLQAHDPIRRAVVQIFAPASEHGSAGLEELQQQTVNLFAFKNQPKAIFDAQLAFNMLARYGEAAPAALEQTELRIERHLATLLALPGEGEAAPMPSLRLIQAPIFHGYVFSVWVEFEGNPGVEAIESGLASDWIEVRGPEVEPPTNVGNAGHGGISVGAIVEDRNDPDACWFWAVADNLRLAAENAVAVARQLV